MCIGVKGITVASFGLFIMNQTAEAIIKDTPHFTTRA